MQVLEQIPVSPDPLDRNSNVHKKQFNRFGHISQI